MATDIVVEIGEDLMPFLETFCAPVGYHGQSPIRVPTSVFCGAVKPEINERTDELKRGRRPFHIVQAERDTMLAEAREHLVDIPARISKLHHVMLPSRQRRQKRAEAIEVE